MHQERLATEHAALGQLAQVVAIARYYAAPKAHVYPAFAVACLLFQLQGLARGRHGQRVERHVHERSHAAGSGCSCRRFEAFPLGAAGLVDVHVAVHEARPYHAVAKIDGTGHAARAAHDFGNLLAFDQHGGFLHAGRQHHARAAVSGHAHQNSVSAKPHRLWKCAALSSTNSERVMPETSRVAEYLSPEMLAPPKPMLSKPPKV